MCKKDYKIYSRGYQHHLRLSSIHSNEYYNIGHSNTCFMAIRFCFLGSSHSLREKIDSYLTPHPPPPTLTMSFLINGSKFWLVNASMDKGEKNN